MLLRYETADELESPDTPYVKSCLRVTKTVPYHSGYSLRWIGLCKCNTFELFSRSSATLSATALLFAGSGLPTYKQWTPRDRLRTLDWRSAQIYTSDPCPQATYTPIPTHSFLKRIQVLGCSHGSSCNHSVPLFQVRQYVYSVNGVNVLREDHHKVAQRIMGSDKDYINICVMSHKRDIKDK